jgi:Domain of unknown function (DUF4132)
MLSFFLRRLGQSLGGKPFAETATAAYFAKTLGADMAGRIGRYVADGENSSILSDISAQGVQVKWRGRSYIFRHNEQQEALFRDPSLWRVDQMHRYGEILALLEPIAFDWGHFGTKVSPDWLRHVVTSWIGLAPDAKTHPLATMLALIQEGGLGIDIALDIVFSRDADSYGANSSRSRFAGVDIWLREDADAIGTAATKAAAVVRGEVAVSVGRFGLQSLYFPFLLDMATGTAKGARKAARQALTGVDAATLAPVMAARFAKDSPARRVLMVEAMAETLGQDAAPLLTQLREGETSAPVLSAMDRVSGAVDCAAQLQVRDPWQQDGKAGYLALDGEWVTAPPRAEPPPKEPIAQDALDLLVPVIEAYNVKVLEERARYKDIKDHWARKFKPLTQSAIKKLSALAEMDYSVEPKYGTVPWLYGYLARHSNIDQFFDHPSVDLRHLVRMARGMGSQSFDNMFGSWAGPAGIALQRRVLDGADMRVVYDIWRDIGGEPFFAKYLANSYWGDTNALGKEAWPLLLHHLPELDEALGLTPRSESTQMSALRGMKQLQLFPKVPERYRSRLMMLANESSLQMQQAARNLLAGAKGIEDGIALQLDDGKQSVRASAADWLVARGAKGYIPAIRKRLTIEKSDVARAAMITSLDQLGDDTSDFFNQNAMLAEAEKGLKKALPKGLEWFPFDALPRLSWADGAPVDPQLPRYWVVLAARLKEPGGNALINLWLDRLAAGDAHKLGWMILTEWIAEDTRTPSDEAANAYALSQIDADLKWRRDHVKRYPMAAEYYSTDYDTVFAQIKKAHKNVYLSSGADSKGVLALTSRLEGVDAAPRIRSFLKDHGARTSQARALLDVLSSIGTPATLQVLLSTADRLKQKSVQAHAAALIQDIAERRGWTAGELADRTVPTGGLDENGVLDLDCGQDRMYVARLDEEDRLILLNAAGKEVKALPAPRIDEEKPLIDGAKKALSNARKEVKQVVTAQTERLREAMCMERGWTGEDWVDYIAAHPILGRLAARLIWIGLDEDGAQVASFRPLGDGTFTNAADEDVEPTGFATVKLAHSTLLDTETRAAWQTHLGDYAVVPLFDQLARTLPEMTEAMRRQRSIADREGYMIESFRLRSAATKLGYQRGPAEDGGCFYTYTRPMRDAGLVAEIQFTGSYLPEENIASALISLSFARLLPNGRSGQPVDLGSVPEVLLAESWCDLHEMADKGTGYDADWQKKAAL